MAYPSDLPTVTVRHRIVGTDGTPARGGGRVTAVLTGRLWTGQGSVVPTQYTATVQEDGTYELDLPPVDHPDIVAGRGEAYLVTEPAATIDTRRPGRVATEQFHVAPVTEMVGQTVDVSDVLVNKPKPGGGVERVTITGPATDESLAGIIADPSTQTAATLKDTIAAEADAPARAAAVDELSRVPEVADAAATRAVSVAADPAVAGTFATEGTATRAQTDNLYAGRARAMATLNLNAQPGVTGDGTTDDTAALQTALDAAATFGLRATAHGAFRTNSTLTITGNADLTDAKILHYGTGAAVRIEGDNLEVHAPEVEHMGTRWAAGTIGIDVVDTQQSTIHVPYTSHFETGLRVYGHTRGCAYNTIHLGDLRNSKVNLHATGTENGWPNQNTFIGGRFWHYSLTADNVVGTRHIKLGQDGAGWRANNNIFINPSIEGSTATYRTEYAIDFAAASDNVILGGRFERTGVRWTSNAQRNVLIGGYGLHSLTETGDRGDNSLIGPMTQSLTGNPASPLLTLRHTAGYGSDTIAVRDPLDGLRRWAFRAHEILGRRSTDTHERLILNGSTAALQLGDGAGTYVTLDYASGHLRLDGGNFICRTDNTYDIGLASSFRPRDVNTARNVNAAQDVRATRYVRVGNAYMRESGGILQASLTPAGPWKNVLDLN